MQYEQCTVARLRQVIEDTSYAGGSNLPSFDDVYRYIEGKRLEGVRVVDLFEWCGWAPVRNAKRAENGLLEIPTIWNQHRVSNVGNWSGYVYVLRKSRPWTTAGKVIATAGAAGIFIVGLMALNEALKLPPPPPPPAPPPTY
jgi:hypothetical protein